MKTITSLHHVEFRSEHPGRLFVTLTFLTDDPSPSVQTAIRQFRRKTDRKLKDVLINMIVTDEWKGFYRNFGYHDKTLGTSSNHELVVSIDEQSLEEYTLSYDIWVGAMYAGQTTDSAPKSWARHLEKYLGPDLVGAALESAWNTFVLDRALSGV